MPQWLGIQLANYYKHGPDAPDDPDDGRGHYAHLNKLFGPYSFDDEEARGRRIFAWVNHQLHRSRWMYDYSALSAGLADGPPQHVNGKPRYSTGWAHTALGNAEKRGLDLLPIARRLCQHSDSLTDSEDAAQELLERYHDRKDGLEEAE